MHDNCQYEIDKICAEIITLTADAAKPSAAADADKLHGEICAKFDAAIRLSEAERLPVSATKELLYPLAAFADETLMAIPRYRARWMANPLQLRYFGEMVAGTEFFSRLEKLLETPENNVRLTELYFVCLALGFKGKYGTSDPNALRDIFEKAGAAITDVRHNGQRAAALFSRGYARKKFLSLQKCLCAAFLLLMIAAAAVYLSSLAEYLNFLERFL